MTRRLGTALVTIAFLGAVIGGVGAPLITSVSLDLGVPLDAAQWTLTITLFAGAVSAPILGRLGAGPHRRASLLAALGLVALGGLLTALPLSFGILLTGRALQGLGLGVTALLMSIARDHLDSAQAKSTIATVAVASTVGIGIAYPLMGLLDQLSGPRAAYGAGFLLSLLAVLIAWRAVPVDPPRPAPRLDLPGAVLLVVAQPAIWHQPLTGICILLVAALALAAWVLVERRAAAPLVDLRILVTGGVLRANCAMLLAGIGMYLLFSLLTRYVQTPPDAGYGFALSGVLAGAALIPFSLLGFVAGRLTPRLAASLGDAWTFVVCAAAVMVAAVLFALLPQSLLATLAAMGVLGYGVGGASAVMPALVLAGAPVEETASVLSINQIVRSVAFSIGSALAGLLLAAATGAGDVFPSQVGYALAALCVVPLLLISGIPILSGRMRSAS
jgi:predicted MFS family arabinose efflux permease